MKSLVEAYTLGITLGFVGAHQFYLGRANIGFLYLFTGGLLGIGWVIDLIRMPWLVKEANNGRDAGKRISLVDAYTVGLTLGCLGCHQFYMGRITMGMVYMYTCGLLGVGWVIDLFRMPWLVRNSSKGYDGDRPNLFDAYQLWFPCGLLGAHRFYLGDPIVGLVYLFTGGLMGIGWLVDAFKMPFLVKEAGGYPDQDDRKSLFAAYILGASPLGLFGIHHSYLGFEKWGQLYTFTGGLLGIGWVYDWFRMPLLVKRANDIQEQNASSGMRNLDSICLLWLPPFGVLGFHHFYLDRRVWGVLYVFTLGLFGIGWITDFFRLPSLVEERNLELGLVARQSTTCCRIGCSCPSSTTHVTPVSGTSERTGRSSTALPSVSAALANEEQMSLPYNSLNRVQTRPSRQSAIVHVSPILSQPTGSIPTAPSSVSAATAPEEQMLPPAYSSLNQGGHSSRGRQPTVRSYNTPINCTNSRFGTHAGNYGRASPPSYEEAMSALGGFSRP